MFWLCRPFTKQCSSSVYAGVCPSQTLREMEVPQLLCASWFMEFEQWKVTAWYLMQAPVEVSELCKRTGPLRHLEVPQSAQHQDEESLAPVCGEAARWG